jgi:hypothetical protein
MTPLRQFEANRRNAVRSTGPRTEEGKQAPRRNALRHGLTAETVIEGLEDSEDYRGFEAAIIADYDAQTARRRMRRRFRPAEHVGTRGSFEFFPAFARGEDARQPSSLSDLTPNPLILLNW